MKLTLLTKRKLQIGLTNISRYVSSSTVVKIFFYALSGRRGMAQDYYKTFKVKEHPSLTRAVLQIVNI